MLFRFVLLTAVICLCATTVFAQLTADDIEALKKQGEEEGWTFEVAQNSATQYSLDELCGLVAPPDWQKTARFVEFEPSKDLPVAFDWRDQGLPSVKNQGGCGSCWAFGTVGPLECNIMLQDGIEVDLSEQYLVSCNNSGWDCGGGWWAHDYHEWRGDGCGDSGAVFESQSEYVAWDAPCGCPYQPREYWINDWAYIGSSGGTPPVPYIKQAILDYGPVSTAIYANSAMQAYNGGVFNGCSSGDVNHGVTLVGWDDNVGSAGCWIIRNSWGAGWGEGGYGWIPYGCNQAGYGACYVDYRGGASFDVDTAGGWAPIDVQFTAVSGVEVLSWNWEFGDGEFSSEQSPLHIFDVPGYYDVTLHCELPGGDTLHRTRYGCVSAIADTMFADMIDYEPGQPIEVFVHTTNFIPLRDVKISIQLEGTLDINMNTIEWTTEGCRSEHMDYQQETHYNPMADQFSIRLANLYNGGNLPAGSGPVVKLILEPDGPVTMGQDLTINLQGYAENRQPYFAGDKIEYKPAVRNGAVAYHSCCNGIRGNIDGDPLESIDIADLVYLVNYMFGSGDEPPCLKEANVDGDLFEQIAIDDLIHLVTYMFQDGPEPFICF